MVDLATRITNLTNASVLLFQFGMGYEKMDGRHKVRAWIRDSVDNTSPLDITSCEQFFGFSNERKTRTTKYNI